MPEFKDPEEIADTYKIRAERLGPEWARMREVAEVVNGDVVLPLPEMHKHEKNTVANLTQQGLDQLARRVSSVMPNVYFPIWGTTDAAEKAAHKRNQVAYGWWAENYMKKILNRRARWYLGYASAPVMIIPGKNRLPKWQPRSPLDALPADTDLDEYTPSDCIFRTQHTYRWLHDNYPQQASNIRKPANWDPQDDDIWETVFDVVQYNDASENTLVLIGAEKDRDFWNTESLGSAAEILHQVPNRAEIPWTVIPGRISLDKTQGHFDGILGMYQTMAELMAMQIIATRRGIWAREWVVSNPGETAKIITIPDPARGQPGKIQGGKIERQQLDPAFQALQVIHDLENSQRQTAGLPPEFGGQGATNVRTGRRGAQVLGASIDYTIQEANDVFSESLYHENRRAIAIDKAYFNSAKTYHIITRAWTGKVDYTPSKLWDSDKHVVDYPFAGVDLQNLVIEGGQRVAMEEMSVDTFMEMDPAIPDANAERARLHVQKGRRALFTSFEAQASQPDGPYRPADVAKIIRYLKEGMDPEDALAKYDKELQEQQAEAAAEQVPAGDPSMMPGLAPAGAPGQPAAAIPEQAPSMQNLTGLLKGLGTQQTAQKFRS